MNTRVGKGYRAQIRLATPKWADLSVYRKLRAESRRISLVTGVRHEVDHIVPLASPIVCGLHCESNWAIVPQTVNQVKRNVYWPNMPDEPRKLFPEFEDHPHGQMSMVF